MRDNQWLAQQLTTLTQLYFPDITVLNTVFVRFGRSSKTRFGSIIARPVSGYPLPVTYITINSLFRDEQVPEYVIQATLLHEFVHYAHGFHSPLQRKYRYPHRGGIVNKEIVARGASAILEQQEAWVKAHYPTYLRQHKLI
jgi:hypothetical protein